MARQCPLKFINILHIWFSVSGTIIKWGECFSKMVYPIVGVRQGSVLSPLLFSVYVDDMLRCLHRSKIGCQIKYIYFNAFMYADDLLLVSISISDLQKLLVICELEFLKIDMCTNVSKSMCLRVGPRYNACVTPVLIDKKPITWNKALKYLGITILSGKSLRYDFHPAKAKFFGSLNNILGKIGTTSAVRVLLHLTYSKCSPILTYGLEAIRIDFKAFDNLANVHNSIFAKLFGTFDRSVIECCHYYTGYLTFADSLDLKRFQFLCKLSESICSPAHYMFHWFGDRELDNLKLKHDLKGYNSSTRWSNMLWLNFEQRTVQSMMC